jgi:hypothetical protein
MEQLEQIKNNQLFAYDKRLFTLNYSDSFSKVLESFFAEMVLLQKLLYRNHNQHRTTLIYTYLRMFNRQMKQFTKERAELLNEGIIQCLKYTIETKITSTDLQKLICTLDLLKLIILAFTKGIRLIAKSATVLKVLLGKKIFGGLYSLFYGLISNLFYLSVRLLLRFASDYDNILSLLKVRTQRIVSSIV